MGKFSAEVVVVICSSSLGIKVIYPTDKWAESGLLWPRDLGSRAYGVKGDLQAIDRSLESLTLTRVTSNVQIVVIQDCHRTAGGKMY